MSQYARRTWVVLWKDLLTERRSKENLNALFFFSLLLLFLFQFALGPDRRSLEAALPGLLWLGFILAGLLGLGRSFIAERDNDCWELLLVTTGLAAVGTLFAAITAQLRARELLFPVLLLPAQVPILLAAVSATDAALNGTPLAEAAHWLKLLAGADLVYIVIGLLTFEFIIEG